jgi:hypothetical protein
MLLPLSNRGLSRTVRLVVLLNLGYFSVEFALALAIGSVSLFADSIDFLEDASANLLIVVALGWQARNRAGLGMALAGILLVPGLDALDGVGEVQRSTGARAIAAVAHRPRCAGGQHDLCLHAGSLPPPRR